MDIPGIRYRVIKHLPAYLLKYGSVDLHQIGRFRLVGHSSTIDHGNALIYPPFYDVEYEPGKGENSSDYVQYLSQRLGLDDALVKEVMLEYVTSLRTQLDNADPVKLEGIGILIRKPDFTVNFESDEAYWGRSAVAELAVAFTPVPRMKDLSKKEKPNVDAPVLPIIPKDVNTEEIEESASVSEDAVVQEITEPDETTLEQQWEEEVQEETIEPATVSVNDLFKEPSEPTFRAEPETEDIDADTTHLTTKADNTRVDTPPMMSDVSIQRQRSNGNRLAIPILLGLLLLAIPISYYLFSEKSTANQQRTAERIDVPADRVNQTPTSKITTEPKAPKTDEISKKNESEINEVNEPKEVESTMKKPADSDAKSHKLTEINNQINNDLKGGNKTYTSGDCIIVVGAFGSGPNREKMIQKLETKGYRVYVDSARSLSRVGIYTSCSRSELQGQLARIKTEIESSSWILKGR